MAAPSRSVRRGLPRTAGGDAWPPAREVPVDVPAVDAAPAQPVASAPAAADAATPVEPATVASAPAAMAPAAGGGDGATVSLRRGLPRTSGGEPWPPAGSVASPSAPAQAAPSEAAAVETTPAATDSPAAAGTPAPRRGLPRPGSAQPPAAPAEPASAPARTGRQGLPRPGAAPEAAPVPAAASVAEVPPAAPASVPVTAREPLPFTRTVWPGAAAAAPREPKPEPRRYGPFTRGQWAGAVIVGGVGLIFVAAMAVALVRWFLSLTFMQEWMMTYPGEYHLPESAPVGFPAWLNWSHFLNVFFMLLIIRSGLQVRREKRPTAFWSPRWNDERKISLTLWFHQSLDILWLLNGVTFVVLLFVSGQWMRIVPTSWEVFPNALSAVLQYVSLDWPTENGWVNYNSLQTLAYFATVFIAAPLAAVTGVRMSGIWPKNAKTLSRIYPVEWARAVHFPVMLYFVGFIIVHVALVFATGALRNLNHMYAAQGSPDPNAYADNWVGFWIFVASMVVLAAGWVAARPLVLAPIAGLFGTVKGR